MLKVGEKPPAFRELDLSGCGTRSLALELFRYEFLTALNVSHNKLTSIPAAIQRLTLLTYLDASSNKITAIPKMIYKCTRLQQLILSQNLITTLPAEIALMSELAELLLEENPLQEPFATLKNKGTIQIAGYLRDNSRGLTLSDPSLFPHPHPHTLSRQNLLPSLQRNESG